MKNLKTKTALVIALFVLSIFSTNAQINLPKNNTIKNIELKKNNPANLKLNLPNADATIMDIIYGAKSGAYYLTMSAMSITKRNINPNTTGSFSSLVTTPNLSQVYKSVNDELSAASIFKEKGENYHTKVIIRTTKYGGQKVKVKHPSTNGRFRELKNVKAAKRGDHRFIITGEYEKDGQITNYIFHIFDNIIQ